MTAVTRLTASQQRMLAMLERYDRYGAEDPIHFDTRDGRTKRTLRALDRAGLIETWQDVMDGTRTWAALPQGKPS
jgi:hypothetical protein